MYITISEYAQQSLDFQNCKRLAWALGSEQRTQDLKEYIKLQEYGASIVQVRSWLLFFLTGSQPSMYNLKVPTISNCVKSIGITFSYGRCFSGLHTVSHFFFDCSLEYRKVSTGHDSHQSQIVPENPFSWSVPWLIGTQSFPVPLSIGSF